jgi:hypothetical protein
MGRINRNFRNYYCDNDIYSYRSQTLFFRPILHVEFDPEKESNTFAPAANGRKFLKIRVHNDGKSTAHDCEAKVKVIIPHDSDSRRFPSDDEKKLVWGLNPNLSDLKDTVNIKKQSLSMLHVIFTDTKFPSVSVREGTRYASFSTMDALSTQAFAVHDTFSDGEFEIEISINAEETNTKAHFKVYVDTNYLNLRMNMLPESTRTKSIKSKILNIFK